MKRTIFFTLFLLLTSSMLMSQNWDQIIKAVASDRAVDDNFGYSVSISGDYAIVGAFYEDDDANGLNPLTWAGSAYIFHYNGTTWTQQQKIVASDRASNDFFGSSVSISGDYAIVGAYWEDQNATGGSTLSAAGSAYIFVRSGTTWTQQQKIVASDRAASDYFGYSVSISGDYVIVGAYQEDHDASGVNPMSAAGSAYIFVRSGTTWTEQKKIVASDRAISDYFGNSVSISGDYVIVGAFIEDEDSGGNNTMNTAGSAYIFVRSGTTWTEQQKIVASDRAIDDNFGFSVSIAGEYAIVGSERNDYDSIGNNYMFGSGSAYIFVRSGTVWTEQQKIVASDRGSDDLFGHSVAIIGDYAIVGAYLEDHDGSGGNPISSAGSAYIFARSGTTWTQHKIIAPEREIDDAFGLTVSISEKFAIVGAFLEDDDASGGDSIANAGSVYFFFKNSVSNQFSVYDTTFHDLETVCFNAYDTIKVAENGNPVILESGSEVNFIAGKSVKFFPGFNAKEGCLMNVQITLDSTFCNEFTGSPMVNPTKEKSIEEKTLSEVPQVFPAEKSVRIYPNPNNGNFTLELSNFEDKAKVCIYSAIGGLVYQSTAKCNSFHEIDLPNIKRGIYIVGITSGKEHFNERIIVK